MEINIPPGYKYEFKLKPWKHQADCLRASWNKEAFALLLEYGCGKTYIIINNVGMLYEIGAIEALFVIAPNEVHVQWVDEQIPMHLPDRIPHLARIWTGENTKKFTRSLEDFWAAKNEDKLKIFTMNVEALQMSTRAQNFALQFLKSFQTMLVVDECFAPGTMVQTPYGDRRIEEIKPGDEIYNAIGVDNVAKVSRKRVHGACKINGIICSKSHPFLTCAGWRCAKDIRQGDYLLETTTAMLLLRDYILSERHQGKISAFLQKALFNEMAEFDKDSWESTEATHVVNRFKGIYGFKESLIKVTSVEKLYPKQPEFLNLAADDGHVYFYDLKVKQHQSYSVGRCIVHNSTRIKSPSAKRSRFIVNRLGPLATMRRTLTGNEVTKSPFDIYSPYMFLKKNFWGHLRTFQLFKHRYAEFANNRFPQKVVKLKPGSYECPSCGGYPDKIHIKRQSDRIFPTCDVCKKVVRRETVTCKKCGSTFPPTVGGKCPGCGGALYIKKKPFPRKLASVVDNNGFFEFPKLIKYRNQEELKAKVKEHSFLVRKEDCMDIPKKIYQPLYTHMNPEQTEIYAELKKNLYVEYEGVELEVLAKVALRTRFRQIVGGFFPNEPGGKAIPIGKTNPKIERMLYDMEDIDTDAPIIIWAAFTAEIEAITDILRRNFDGRTESFYGATTKPDRQKIIQDFRQNKIRFFVGNPSVAGTGLNLQLAYINYYFSVDDNSESRWQSEDRTHRGGQTRQCLYKDIYIKGTIDDTIKKAHQDKKDIAEFFKSNRMEDFLENV